MKKIDRDAYDRGIDAAFMKDTKLPQFDDLFSQTSDPLDTLSQWNNGIVDSIELIKETSAALQGSYKLLLQQKHGEVIMGLYTIDRNGVHQVVTTSNLEDLMQNDGSFNEKYITAQTQMDKLNEGIASDATGNETQWELVHGRLSITKSGKQDVLLNNFNAVLFPLRRQLMSSAKMADLQGAFLQMANEFQTHARQYKPTVVISNDGYPKIVYGKGGDDIENIIKQLPPRLALLVESFNQFQKVIDDAVEGLPALQDKLEAFANEASTIPDKAQEACTSSGMSPIEILKSIKAIKHNASIVSNSPQILKCIAGTMKQVGVDLKTPY